MEGLGFMVSTVSEVIINSVKADIVLRRREEDGVR